MFRNSCIIKAISVVFIIVVHLKLMSTSIYIIMIFILLYTNIGREELSVVRKRIISRFNQNKYVSEVIIKTVNKPIWFRGTYNKFG